VVLTTIKYKNFFSLIALCISSWVIWHFFDSYLIGDTAYLTAFNASTELTRESFLNFTLSQGLPSIPLFFIYVIFNTLSLDYDQSRYILGFLLLLLLYIFLLQKDPFNILISFIGINFYTLVLIFSATKLQVAFIFLFLASLLSYLPLALFCSLLSILSHPSIILIFPLLIQSNFHLLNFANKFSLKYLFRPKYKHLVVAIIGTIALYILFPHLETIAFTALYKFNYNLQNPTNSTLTQALVALSCLSILGLKIPSSIKCYLIILALSLVTIGTGRLLIIIYFGLFVVFCDKNLINLYVPKHFKLIISTTFSLWSLQLIWRLNSLFVFNAFPWHISIAS